MFAVVVVRCLLLLSCVVYKAVYLEKLTASCLLQQLVTKLGWLSLDLVVSFVQLILDLNLLVEVDDAVVQTMQDQDIFSVQTIKRKSVVNTFRIL